VFRAEGENQIQTFLAHNTEALLQPAPGHLLPPAGAIATSVPENQSGEYDGFYFARLDKRV
jgi:16S rRNA (cytosine967-C5)-methyltransferase